MDTAKIELSVSAIARIMDEAPQGATFRVNGESIVRVRGLGSAPTGYVVGILDRTYVYGTAELALLDTVGARKRHSYFLDVNVEELLATAPERPAFRYL